MSRGRAQDLATAATAKEFVATLSIVFRGFPGKVSTLGLHGAPTGGDPDGVDPGVAPPLGSAGLVASGLFSAGALPFDASSGALSFPAFVGVLFLGATGTPEAPSAVLDHFFGGDGALELSGEPLLAPVVPAVGLVGAPQPRIWSSRLG